MLQEIYEEMLQAILIGDKNVVTGNKTNAKLKTDDVSTCLCRLTLAHTKIPQRGIHIGLSRLVLEILKMMNN